GCILVTSRPLSDLKNSKLESFKDVSLVGFTRESIVQYISKYFPELEEEEVLNIALLYESTPTVWELCQIPLFLEFYCSYFPEGITDAQKKSMTDIYTMIIERMYEKFQSKFPENDISLDNSGDIEIL